MKLLPPGKELNDMLEAAGVGIAHHFADHLYAKEIRLPAGREVVQHVHPFDHFSFVGEGTVIVEVDGTPDVVTGPALLVIKAGKSHRVRAMTDALWYCVHACDDSDPATVDETILSGHAPRKGD